MSNTIHRRIDLFPAEWQRLDELAKETRSRSTHGTNAYQWSWTAMLRRIASGDITIQEREPYALPAWLDEAADAVEAQQRQQAEQEAQRQRIAEQACPEGSQQRKTPAVKLVQLDMLTELEPA